MAFEGVEPVEGLFPALTCAARDTGPLKLRVDVGDRGWVYGPPSAATEPEPEPELEPEPAPKC